MFELLKWKKTSWDFIKWRRYAFCLSGVLVTLGIIGTVQIFLGNAPLGVDFAGGTLVEIGFQKPVDIGAIRVALEQAGWKESVIQKLGDSDNMVLVRVAQTESVGAGVAGKLIDALTKAFPDNPVDKGKISSEEVGPAVGSQLRQQALWAVFWALIGIMAYIWIRFDFSFGVAAAIATLHDVLATIGMLWIFHKEFTLLIITALLTLAGYSLTDTVVVFDRIRENLRYRRKETYGEVINKSVNEVLSRTIITSSTVLLVLLALYFLGGDVIHDFSWAMLFGVCVGTYSSVYVASPILVEWEVLTSKKPHNQ